MRSDPAIFHAANTALSKEPRHVVNIVFDVASVFPTSHDDIPNVPGVVIQGVVRRPTAVSQRIVPDQGRSEMGSANFELVDVGSAFTDEMRAKLASGRGLRGRTVRFYHGYAGMDFTQFVLRQTQIVREADYSEGGYRVSCRDITREQRKEIFQTKVTTLTADLSATATTIQVNDATAFVRVFHGTSYSDSPSSTVGYLKIDEEVIRYTGSTPNSFTGCTRGVFGTKAAAYTIDPAVAQDRREKVTEYIYLELPIPKLIYALLTGVLHGDSANLPAHWHLGIDPAFVRVADYTGIGPDLWTPGTDTNALIGRGEGLTKSDGKGLIERELLTLIGCYTPVYADGALGLKRMTHIMRDAAPVLTLDESNSVQVGELVHDMDAMHNDFAIDWNWNGERFTRTTLLHDQASIDVHGKAPLKRLAFKFLHGSRHTDGFVLKALDLYRDRYAAPPERLTVRVFNLHNALEVGDVVRAKYASVRDYAGPAGSIDRSFEIQNIADDGVGLDLELLGSTTTANVQSPTTPATALPDAFYNSQGTNLTSVLTIVGDVVQAGTYNLTGHADLNNAAAIFYYLGNLTIADGAIINITGNIQLRIRGFLQINGDIVGQGGGLAGVVDSGATLLVSVNSELNPSVFNTIAGNPGFVGNSRGMDGVQTKEMAARIHREHTIPVAFVQAKNPTAPVLSFNVSGNSLTGLPADLRGSGGAPGGRTVRLTPGAGVVSETVGGSGANGGAGLCIICRGMAFGASGSIDLDGNDSAATVENLISNFGDDLRGFPGAGGAGAPGTMYVLLDGSGLSVPGIGINNFSARCGTVPVNGFPLPKRTFNDAIGPIQDAFQPVAGFMDESFISAADLFNAAQRIQYIPASETPAPDVDSKPPAPTGLTATGESGFIAVRVTLPGFETFDVAEVWASLDNNRANAVQIGEGRKAEFKLELPVLATRFLWSRTRKIGLGNQPIWSDWFPLSATGGISATTQNPGGWTPVPRGAGGATIIATTSTLQKSGGTSAWDSDCYSAESFFNGSFVSFRAAQTNADFMIGLNTDPVTDQSYTSIDFAWHPQSNGQLDIYESGTLVVDNVAGAYDTSTILSITHDGQFVRYLRNGTVIRTVAISNLTLALDSSFFTPGSKALDVKFGPMGSRGVDGEDGDDGAAGTPGPALFTLVAGGNCVIGTPPNIVTKVGGSSAWDSSARSTQGFPQAFVSFRAAQTNLDLMIGLNTDPTTDQNFTSLDFAWQCRSNGTLDIYESGSLAGSFGSYTTSTILSIIYDGKFVRYLKDGLVVRAVPLTGAILFFDSSFFSPGGSAVDIGFGPTGRTDTDFLTGIVFLETWEHQRWEAFYNNRANGGSLVVTYPNNGEFGGKVIRAAGARLWIASIDNIPYDPNATYRISAQVRRIAAGGGGAGTQLCYVGVEGVAADGVTLINEAGSNSSSSQHYNCFRAFDLSTVALDTWVTRVGYFRGLGTTPFGVAAHLDAPTVLRTGVRYFRPLIILNYDGGTGTQECDWIRVERLVTPDDADNTGKKRLVPDAEFALATDDTHWYLQTSSGNLPTIALTGGNVYGRLIFDLSQGDQIAVSRRNPPLQAITGELWTLKMRWRRTGTVTGGPMQLRCMLWRHALAYATEPFGFSSVINAAGFINLTDTEINARTVDVWQEEEGISLISGDTGFDGGEVPFLSLSVDVFGGTNPLIEVDFADATPGAGSPQKKVFTSGFTIGGEHLMKLLQYNSASAGTFTLPAPAAALVGVTCYFEQLGAGLLTIASTSLRSPPGVSGNRALSGQYARAFAECNGTNWFLNGSLT